MVRSESMHILFVEDEAKIANFVRAGLKEQGFVLDYCDNGDDGYTRALDNEYDAIVLDIMMPGKDGLSILKNLRHPHTTQTGRNSIPVEVIVRMLGLKHLRSAQLLQDD